MITVWEARGARHNSRHRATAASMVHSVEGEAQELGPFDAFHGHTHQSLREADGWRDQSWARSASNRSRGGPFAQAQASVLVAAQESPELRVVVARQALSQLLK